MKKNNIIWKIIQSDNNEYILLSDSDIIKKIKGKNSHDIVSVLLSLQKDTTNVKIREKISIENFEKEYINDIIEWLKHNHFIEEQNISTSKINIIGEFGDDNFLLNEFIDYLKPKIEVNKIFNLSENNNLLEFKYDFLTLLIGPFFYNQDNIKKISELQEDKNIDFLYTEIYQNGILLGPLMNLEKETACLNCLKIRRVFNTSTPSIIIENLIKKNNVSITNNNVFEIGDFNINKVFIYNELKNIITNSNKKLYNKSIFIDFNKYQNQYFNITKAPNCNFCVDKTIYNPL
jgi:bacteriocin biosynthesis cyclodehydratase domain-containing protein